MRSLSCAAGLALLICHIASPASAAIIFDNEDPIGFGSLANSDFAISQQWADDFVLSSTLGTTITRVHWLGIYNRESLGEPLPQDNFTLRIFAVRSGSPTAPATNPILQLSLGTANRNDTGVNIFGGNLYEYDVFIPATTLLPGTRYWLSIVNNTVITNHWQWVLNTRKFPSNSAQRQSDGAAWESLSTSAAAFRLSNDVLTTAVPEPGSGIIWGAALALGALFYRGTSRPCAAAGQ